jgi:hypothetical protein
MKTESHINAQVTRHFDASPDRVFDVHIPA